MSVAWADCASGVHDDCPDRWGEAFDGCGCSCHVDPTPSIPQAPVSEYVTLREVFINGVLGYRAGADIYAQVVRDFGLVVGVDVAVNRAHSAAGGKPAGRQS